MSKTVFSCRALPHLVHALAALEKNPTAVKNGFKRAGIYPPDPDAINYDACAPSKKFEDGVQPSEDAEVADAGDEELGEVGGGCTGGDLDEEGSEGVDSTLLKHLRRKLT